MSEEGRFTIHLEQQEGFKTTVQFDWAAVPDLLAPIVLSRANGRGDRATRTMNA